MIKTVNWNGNELHCIEWLIDGEIEWCFIAKEVHRVLGYDKLKYEKEGYSKNISRDLKQHCDEEEYFKVKYKELNEKLNNNGIEDLKISKQGETLLTSSGVIKLTEKSNSMSNKDKLSFFEIIDVDRNDIIILNNKKEIEFINNLEECIKKYFEKDCEDFIGIKQYQVLNYRIDYYIPSLNIAIEYDEDNHKNYTYEQQILRQLEIEKELGCRFIRVDDSNDIINLALTFSELTHEYLKQFNYTYIVDNDILKLL